MKADTVLLNGIINTLGPSNTAFQAIAIKDSKILELGSDTEIERYVDSGTTVFNLEGRTVTPGFVDSHNHTCEYGFNELILDLRYPRVKSIKDVVQLLRNTAQSKPIGAWIRGIGWDDALIDEKRPPIRQDLDPVSPNHPVILDAQTPVQVANS